MNNTPLTDKLLKAGSLYEQSALSFKAPGLSSVILHFIEESVGKHSTVQTIHQQSPWKLTYK